MKRIAIIGSRHFNDYPLLKSLMDRRKDSIQMVVSGGANGADSLGARWATENNILTKIFKPDWDLYGKRAGYLRNEQIIQNCDICVAFWDGESKGTKHSIDLCKKMDKPCLVVRVEKKS